MDIATPVETAAEDAAALGRATARAAVEAALRADAASEAVAPMAVAPMAVVPMADAPMADAPSFVLAGGGVMGSGVAGAAAGGIVGGGGSSAEIVQTSQMAYARVVSDASVAPSHPGDATPRLLLVQSTLGDYAKGRLLLSPWSAFRGVFPMHGTYFAQNEVFEDEAAGEASLCPSPSIACGPSD